MSLLLVTKEKRENGNSDFLPGKEMGAWPEGTMRYFYSLFHLNFVLCIGVAYQK